MADGRKGKEIMLVHKDEARGKYCPFKFMKPGTTDWSCSSENCMAWNGKVLPGREDFGFCGLAGKPIELMRMLKVEEKEKR
jgi:hypothetical protein